MKNKNVVVIGGGTGTYTVLTGLKKYPVNLTAIVSMADDGGSTKILREEFGILPPGSVRPALVALSQAPKILSNLFNFRFDRGGLKGHNFGNLFITALTQHFGDFEKALEEVHNILRIQGRVLPSTLSAVRLFAELEDGTLVEGEAHIDVPKHNGELKIKKVWLNSTPKANPKALDALHQADLVVVGPGDIFSSVVPNFLVKDIAKAFQKSKAKKVYVCNIMTKFGETTGFEAHDFLSAIEAHAGPGTIDYMIINIRKPSRERIKKYEKERAEFVEYNPSRFKAKKAKIVAENVVRAKGFIRHDPAKLAKIIISLL